VFHREVVRTLVEPRFVQVGAGDDRVAAALLRERP